MHPDGFHRFTEILNGIDEEKRITAGVTWRELLQPINRYRIFLIVALQIGKYLTSPITIHIQSWLTTTRRSANRKHITSIL